MKPKSWKWERAKDTLTVKGDGWILRDARGRNRANVWSNGVWHTYNEEGTGGENDVCTSVRDALDQAIAAVIRQGWTAFKVIYGN